MADQAVEGMLSPWLRKKRLTTASAHLNGRVLDFGCGSGELAAMVPSGLYVGVDRDELSLTRARLKYPRHRFVTKLSDELGLFDTVVSLAVIEHVKDPSAFLAVLADYLVDSPRSSLVVTTPHPTVDWIHDLGASIGLFSGRMWRRDYQTRSR